MRELRAVLEWAMATPLELLTSTPGRPQADGLLALLGDIFNALPVAVLVVDADRKVVMFNHEAEVLLGYRNQDVLGRSVDIFVPEGLRQGHAEAHRAYLESPTPRRMGANRDLLARRADGGLVPVEIALKPIPGTNGPMVIAAIVDISARKALEAHALAANAELERRVSERTTELERSNRDKQAMLECLERTRADLERLSRKDPLTGLANRREFEERMSIELERSRRHAAPLSVAMLDIDRFKNVNDSFGHALGDEVLRRLAEVLQKQCRSVDILARHGGEEFALALPDTGLKDAAALCERMRDAVAVHPWQELRPDLRVTISGGVASLLPGESADHALARADASLYQAKREGRNRVVGST